MTGIFSAIFGWIRDKILSFFLIVALLLVTVWAQGEISKIAEYEKRINAANLAIKKIDGNLQKLKNKTDPLSRAYADALRFQQGKEGKRRAYALANPILTTIPFTSQWKHLKALDAEILVLIGITKAAGDLVDAEIKVLEQARKDQIKIKAEYDEYLISAQKWKELLPTFWLAAGILALAVATGIAIKFLLYFVIAPMASRLPPIRILPEVNGSIRSGLTPNAAFDSGKISLVSIPISLKENQELLVRPEYLQSTSVQDKTSTQLFLNSAIPYTCLLSGMFLLTKVRSPASKNLVVSATKDPLSELCVVDLPDQTAFVCQPRALVGVVQDPSHPIDITRHWRLGSLHSWLTLQLRFLVFHGPGQLIVNGCRGVRMENAGTGRIINQAATLGFSANIYYANTRCETFMSYWMGKDDLFNDIFTGEMGSYIYEEMPDFKHKSGIAGRGLEGVIDGGLKLFGI